MKANEVKLHVAYKSETNFVDVIPQASQLQLSINVPFAEISDPKELCRDITNISRWRNGEVEVGLKSIDERPYIVGFVRQSYERQVGGEGQL